MNVAYPKDSNYEALRFYYKIQKDIELSINIYSYYVKLAIYASFVNDDKFLGIIFLFPNKKNIKFLIDKKDYFPTKDSY